MGNKDIDLGRIAEGLTGKRIDDISFHIEQSSHTDINDNQEPANKINLEADRLYGNIQDQMKTYTEENENMGRNGKNLMINLFERLIETDSSGEYNLAPDLKTIIDIESKDMLGMWKKPFELLIRISKEQALVFMKEEIGKKYKEIFFEANLYIAEMLKKELGEGSKEYIMPFLNHIIQTESGPKYQKCEEIRNSF